MKFFMFLLVGVLIEAPMCYWITLIIWVVGSFVWRLAVED